jgi:predicted cobalt transporter CbtA
LSAWLALAAFITLVIVPNIKYPANPPSVGDPETIGMRTGLFFLMIAISIVTMVFSLKVRKYAIARLGQWNASIVAGVVFVAIIGVVQLNLPVINEVPAAFPAVLLWKFRVAAIGMQVILWTTIGLLFGALAERVQRAASTGRITGKSAYL